MVSTDVSFKIGPTDVGNFGRKLEGFIRVVLDDYDVPVFPAPAF